MNHRTLGLCLTEGTMSPPDLSMPSIKYTRIRIPRYSDDNARKYLHCNSYRPIDNQVRQRGGHMVFKSCTRYTDRESEGVEYR
jgi:hypothetical protein